VTRNVTKICLSRSLSLALSSALRACARSLGFLMGYNNNNNNNVLYYNCRHTLQRTFSNICHAGQYTIIEYTQRIHAVQHGNVSSYIGALLLNAVQTETTIKHIIPGVSLVRAAPIVRSRACVFYVLAPAD